MKIILEIPKSATALAAMMLSDSCSEEAIEKATKACEENPVELNLSSGDIASALGDKSEIQAFNMGLALIALGVKLEEQKKEEQKPSGLAGRLLQMQEEKNELENEPKQNK